MCTCMNGMFHPRIQYPDLLGRSVPLGFLKLVILSTNGYRHLAKIFNEFSSVPDLEQDSDPYQNVTDPEHWNFLPRSISSRASSGAKIAWHWKNPSLSGPKKNCYVCVKIDDLDD